MDMIPESKKNHLWRKIVWHTDPDLHPLGPHHYVEIYCCEESNGYAVWYVRRLPKDDERGVRGTDNADYLLQFFSKTARDDAIERAVLLANGTGNGTGEDAAAIIESLDRLAGAAQKV